MSLHMHAEIEPFQCLSKQSFSCLRRFWLIRGSNVPHESRKPAASGLKVPPLRMYTKRCLRLADNVHPMATDFRGFRNHNEPQCAKLPRSPEFHCSCMVMYAEMWSWQFSRGGSLMMLYSNGTMQIQELRCYCCFNLQCDVAWVSA